MMAVDGMTADEISAGTMPSTASACDGTLHGPSVNELVVSGLTAELWMLSSGQCLRVKSHW